MLPRARAEWIYGSIVERRRDPALLRYVGFGQYRLSVFPVPAQGEMKVSVTFVHLLAVKDGVVTYRAPVIESLSSGGERTQVGLDVTIRNAKRVEKVEPLHGTLRRLPGGSKTVRVAMAPAMVSLDRAIGVRYRYEGLTESLAVADEPVDGMRCIVLRRHVPVPPADLDRPVIYVFDASASMGQTDLALMKKTFAEHLANVPAGDRINVVATHAGDLLQWKPAPVPADEAGKKDALAFVERLEAAGGTDLAGAMRAAMAMLQPGRRGELVVLSDGRDTVGARWGGRPEKETDDLAVSTAGMELVCLSPGRLSWGMSRLLRRARLAWDARIRADRYRRDVKELSRWHSVCMGTHRSDAARASLRATKGSSVAGFAFDHWVDLGGLYVTGGGRVRGPGPFRLQVTVGDRKPSYDEAVVISAAAEAPREWVDTLLGRYEVDAEIQTLRIDGGDTSANVQAFRKCMAEARRLRIVTECTALLALETEKDYRQRHIRRTVGPETPPAGPAVTPAADTGDESGLTAEQGKRLAAEAAEAEKNGRLALARQLRKMLADCTGDLDVHWDSMVDEQWERLLEDAARRGSHRDAPTRGQLLALLVRPTLLDGLVGRRALPVSKQKVIRSGVPIRDDVGKKLRARLTDVSLKNIAFSDALDYFREITGLNLYVHWKQIEAYHKEARNVPVTVSLKDVSARDFLDVLVSEGRGANIPALTVWVSGNVVHVGERDDADARMDIRLYDVRDLQSVRPPAPPVRRRPSTSLFGADDDAVDSVGTGDLWGSEDDVDEILTRPEAIANVRNLTVDTERSDTPEESEYWVEDEETDYWPERLAVRGIRMAQLRDVLTGMVQRDSWYPNGTASIALLDGVFVVRQTVANHERLERLLNAFRETRLTRYQGFRSASSERLFTEDGRIKPWVAALLRKAREGKLSAFSSVRVREVSGRKYARINGVWLDVNLTTDTRIVALAPDGPAARAILPRLAPNREWTELGPVVVSAIDPRYAVAVERMGLEDAKDARVQALLKALDDVGKEVAPAK